jgi:hypothetical protein
MIGETLMSVSPVVPLVAAACGEITILYLMSSGAYCHDTDNRSLLSVTFTSPSQTLRFRTS